jgi:hypothetical protein
MANAAGRGGRGGGRKGETGGRGNAGERRRSMSGYRPRNSAGGGVVRDLNGLVERIVEANVRDIEQRAERVYVQTRTAGVHERNQGVW